LLSDCSREIHRHPDAIVVGEIAIAEVAKDLGRNDLAVQRERALHFGHMRGHAFGVATRPCEQWIEQGAKRGEDNHRPVK
jgi:hypothetical protein